MNRIILFSFVLIIAACSGPSEPSVSSVVQSKTLLGEAQGTTYKVTYIGDSTDYKVQIDSILNRFDKDLSLWDPNSLICKINAHNRTDSVYTFFDTTRNFSVLWDLSKEVYSKTDGAFDPTVYPLVELWGFGLKNRQDVTSEKVDSVLEFIGFRTDNIDIIEFEQERIYKNTQVRKADARARLDFNAIAQGYSVDLLGYFLEDKGIDNYMVEIGGETRCRGFNPDSTAWRIGIDKPVDELADREMQAILSVKDMSVCTSGNYRNYFEEDGIRYSHSIDPRSGYPAQNNILSATVVARHAADADAYATAFMVMGVDRTMDFLASYPEFGFEVYLICDIDGTNQVIMTPGMSEMLLE